MIGRLLLDGNSVPVRAQSLDIGKLSAPGDDRVVSVSRFLQRPFPLLTVCIGGISVIDRFGSSKMFGPRSVTG